jgi:sulfate permease, SulP family
VWAISLPHCRVQSNTCCCFRSVVGGYLAFIGWFCGVSGIGLMAGSSDVTPSVIVDRFRYICPGVIFGLAIYLVSRRLRHMAVLPVGILMVILLFYGVVWTTNTTVVEATRNGWIREMDPPPVWYHTWDFLRWGKVDWSAMPRLALTELSMIFVVALSSSLDVAAIELELKRPLDYNHELKMVGLSNVVSGMTGGYTGSYIFSQSIFSLRAGIRSRLAGYVLAMCQIIVLVIPVPILAYVPNFFFGTMLSMICIDLMYEWLWDVRKKLSTAEYAICLATFGLIQLLSVEYGMLAGVALYMLCEKLGLDVGVPKIAPQEVAEGNFAVELPWEHRDFDERLSHYGST